MTSFRERADERPFTVVLELDIMATDALAASGYVRTLARDLHIAHHERFAPDGYRVRGVAPRWMPPFGVTLVSTDHDGTTERMSKTFSTLSAAWRELDDMLHMAIRAERWPRGAQLRILDSLGGVIATRDEAWFHRWQQGRLSK